MPDFFFKLVVILLIGLEFLQLDLVLNLASIFSAVSILGYFCSWFLKINMVSPLPCGQSKAKGLYLGIIDVDETKTGVNH